MKSIFKKYLKELLPPAIVPFLQRFSGNIIWTGNYHSWDEAKSLSTGYNTKEIIDKVIKSISKVRNGEAAFERDSVLFKEIEYSWPVLSGLMWVAALNNGELNVLDFGGSLGSTYYQNRYFLHHLKRVEWSIVEQAPFVEAGKAYFENERLKFYSTIESCIEDRSPNMILFSGVIQYLKEPYTFLNNIVSMDFKYILFDRTSFIKGDHERLTIQKVPDSIYRASYPCWFFNKNRFLEIFASNYDLIAEFKCSDRINIPSTFEGFVFKKI